MPIQTQVLIVGQGIAGTALGLALEKRGIDFLVVDPGHATAASAVAVGLISPVTGQRLVKSWAFEQLYPLAEKFYSEIETQMGERIVHPYRLLRIFKSEDEAFLYQERFNAHELDPFAGTGEIIREVEGLRTPFGAAYFDPAIRVELPRLIEWSRKRWVEEGKLVSATVTVGAVDMSTAGIRFGEIVSEKMILCAGAGEIVAQLAPSTRFQFAKGEILRLSGLHLDRGTVPSRGHWAVSMAGGNIQFGATYSRLETNFTPTKAAREELEKSATEMFDSPFRVTGHDVGIRAFTADKLPLGGYVDASRRIGILGGLGSKGALYAPWLASEWAVSLQSDGLGSAV